MITPTARIKILRDRLSKLTNRVNNEYDLQRAVAYLLPEAAREHPLPGGRVDFWLDGIAIECKVKGTAQAVVRQLLRYEPAVDGLILVSTKPFIDADRDLFDAITKPFVIVCPSPF